MCLISQSLFVLHLAGWEQENLENATDFVNACLLAAPLKDGKTAEGHRIWLAGIVWGRDRGLGGSEILGRMGREPGWG
jgi:hypothetical protein